MRKIIFNLDSYTTRPWWFVAELLTEFLALNPPVHSKYRPDIVEQSYKLSLTGECSYCYGQRWSEHHQIDNVRKRLTENPNSKKAIIMTWMPYDTRPDISDSPCNISYMFLNRNGKLDMTATIRSNDLFKGIRYDYALASSMLQNMASFIGQEVGELYFHINSLHAYRQDFENLEMVINEIKGKFPVVLSLPTHITIEQFYRDFRRIKTAEESSYCDNFSYFQKCVESIEFPIYRDFARVFGLKNFKKPHNNFSADRIIRNEWETEELRDWALNSKYR